MEVEIVGTLEVSLEIFSLIFCIIFLMVFGISREMIKREELLLEKLSDEEIKSNSMKNTNSKIFLMVSLVSVILCCIYLVISIVNKGLLIDFFDETLNKVINSIVIVVLLLRYLLERINVVCRYNKVKQKIESK